MAQVTVTVQNLLHNDPRNWDISDSVFKHGDRPFPIGNGSYGDVYYGYMVNHGNRTHYRQNSPVVIKTLRGSADTYWKVRQRVDREIVVWSTLNHDNVARFLGITNRFGPTPGLVSPYLPYTLMEYLYNNPSYASKTNLARQVANGLSHLHERGVTHGDLKIDNVRVNHRGVAKIIDFGIAQIVLVQGFTTTIQRNARFTAPELMPILAEDENLPLDPRPNHKSDIFSFSILLLQLFHGPDPKPNRFMPYNHIPYNGNDYHVPLYVHRDERPRRGRYNPISDAHWGVMTACWERDPSARPDVETILHLL